MIHSVAMNRYEAESLTCVVSKPYSTHSDRDTGEPGEKISCSGILLSESLVLTHGCILSTCDERAKQPHLYKGFEVTIMLPNSTLETTSATLISTFDCHDIHLVLSSMFHKPSSSVKLAYDKQDEMEVSLLSKFLVLQLNSRPKHSRATVGLFNMKPTICEMQSCNTVMLCSTPFGISNIATFINSWSLGIVSNTLDTKGSAHLCDLRSTPGCQGAIVYRRIRNKLYPSGIVLHPVFWRQQEPSGLAIVGSLKLILTQMAKVLSSGVYKQKPDPHPDPTPSAEDDLQSVLRRVVRVVAGNSWGSGVLLSSQYILTCAHVVRNCRQGVKVKGYHIKNGEAVSIKYISQSSYELFDIAILEINPSRVKTDSLAANFLTPAHAGQEVVACGYGIFEKNDTPSITLGAVSKSTRTYVTTTCKVYSGSSGGLIADRHSGLPVAMITANTQDDANDIIYTNVSYGVPLTLLIPAVKDLLSNQSVKGFRKLETELNLDKESLSTFLPHSKSKL